MFALFCGLLSYSLRALLLFMLVVALLSFWVGRRIQHARQQRATLTQIEAAGWQVSFDNDNYDWEHPNWWHLLVDPNPLDQVVRLDASFSFNGRFVRFTVSGRLTTRRAASHPLRSVLAVFSGR